MVDSPNNEIGHLFVGRQREMSELRAALDDALGGERPREPRRDDTPPTPT